MKSIPNTPEYRLGGISRLKNIALSLPFVKDKIFQ